MGRKVDPISVVRLCSSSCPRRITGERDNFFLPLSCSDFHLTTDVPNWKEDSKSMAKEGVPDFLPLSSSDFRLTTGVPN